MLVRELKRPGIMTTHITVWTAGTILTAALLAGGAITADARQDQPAARSGVPHGSYLFTTYCASCHGTTGRGDGPLASAMRRRPPNLTEITKRSGGEFPREMVFNVIDGRQKVPGHGGPDMPVWGDAFSRSMEGGDETAIKARIDALVAYIEAIQVR
jgi:mono/diheme cytochrome c family protein